MVGENAVCLTCWNKVANCRDYALGHKDGVAWAQRQAAPAASPALSEKQVRELTSKIGNAVALFTMEYNDARAKGSYLDYGVDSVIEPVLRNTLLRSGAAEERHE